MLEKGKFCKVYLKKKFLIKIILTYFFLLNPIYADVNQEIIEKLKSINTLTFNFEQNISGKIETGNCKIKYPKLMKCDYNDTYEKRLISNGKTLAIIQRRYKKIFYYRLKSTPLNLILDKEYLIEVVKQEDSISLNQSSIEYEVELNNKKKINILFDKNSLNLKGWKTTDIYENHVDFLVLDLKLNIPMKEDFFKIPSEENL